MPRRAQIKSSLTKTRDQLPTPCEVLANKRVAKEQALQHEHDAMSSRKTRKVCETRCEVFFPEQASRIAAGVKLKLLRICSPDDECEKLEVKEPGN
ncbi:hypothetical protein CDAR_466531 [Caerostris darwini]|uniref:Uncharacterized protein n=1 Tax=Caerostris darwini TaxID=1538125 RepID=A0AAV4PTR5_9ARAC|nr:hypothetical protein CDAR_466531 [Caerostris darwini]